MFANLCALVASSQSLSFLLSKSIFDCSSWQNTLTTFCPFIISWIKPSSSPRDTCCLTKYLALFPPTFFVTKVIRTTPKKITSDNQRLLLNIITNSVVMLIKEVNKWGILCETSWRSASVSFVYELIISPVKWVSKYLIGNDCILSKTAVLT